MLIVRKRWEEKVHAGKSAVAVGAGGGLSRGQRGREKQGLEHTHGRLCLCVKISRRRYQNSVLLGIPLLVSEPIV